MAYFGRPLSRYFLASKSGCFTLKRHLFSSEILGVENFKRIRIFEQDRLSSKTDFVNQVSATYHGSRHEDSRVVGDLIKLIYVAEEKRDVSVVTDLLKQLYAGHSEGLTRYSGATAPRQKLTAEGPLSPQRFQFGPLVFRLLYVLNDLETAQSLYEDEELKWLFQSTSCHLLLLDMLYEAGQFWRVVDVFIALRRSALSARFTPDCTTLALAALYRLNSRESCQTMKGMLEEAAEEGSSLSRRCQLFAAALALNQGEAALALTIAQSLITPNEAVFHNIKLMALAQLGRLEEAVKALQADVHGSFRHAVLYSDTVQKLTEAISTSSSSELQADFHSIVQRAETEGLLSPQTVEHFVLRPILRQKVSHTSQSFKTRLKSPIKRRQ